MYQTVFEQTLFKCRELATSQGGRRKFRFKNKLMSLDGRIVDLSVRLFDWAKYRPTKGAIKPHLRLDHDGYPPSFAVATEGKTSEIKVARTLRLAPGTIPAIDRGYIDYAWFRELTREEVYFATRMKEGAVYEGREELELPQNSNVVRDQIISFPRLKREGEAPWRESKTAEPSDNILGKECAQRTRLQRAVNAEVASLHESPVAETVDNVRKRQGLAETSPMRQLSPAGYQRRHGVKDDGKLEKPSVPGGEIPSRRCRL